jgi:hypothetical protein
VQFSTLYQDELTRELGTADRTQRFTDARRKAAINAAQLEFLERTECLRHQVSVALVDGTGEYNLEAIADFAWISKQGVSIQITDANNNVRYVEGNDLPVTSVENLNAEQTGWRSVAKGTPRAMYVRMDGPPQLGFVPAPGIAAGETWVALVPYVVMVADLVNDNDVPFTRAATPVASLKPYHRALAHFAAYDLEKLRKDVNAQQKQLALFDQYVQRYLGRQPSNQGTHVRLARDYRNEARFGMGRKQRLNRRVYP